MKKKDQIKDKPLSRSLKLLGMATSVASREISNQVKSRLKGVTEYAPEKLKSRIEQARVIAENLSQLKGAAMKAGQLLSMDAAEYFPPEAVEILEKLQAQAEPAPYSQIRDVLNEDLGGMKLSEIENTIVKTAAASASIGQVHRGRINGEAVAIKVQYPGVRESIDADLNVLQKMATGLVAVTGRKIDLSEAFDELRIVLKAEADYDKELKNLDQYRQLASPYPQFIVPRSFPEYSGKRVLAMSWEEGVRVQEWLKTNPSQKDREDLGKMVLDLFCFEFFDWGFVQTDPNYANFLVRENPLRLVVLDFGAALKYDQEFIKQYVALLRAMSSGKRQDVIQAGIEFGILDARESDLAKEYFFEMLMFSLKPFDPALQPFAFADIEYSKQNREAIQRFANSLKFTPPPRKLFFLHRKLGGIFTLLKRLEVRLDLIPYWKKMVGSDLEFGK